jgi:hypothetical protein
METLKYHSDVEPLPANTLLWPRKGKVMFRTFIMLTALLALFPGCDRSADTATQATEPRIGPQGEVMLSAVALAQDYATDPAAFDRKYSGKLVIIEGIVAFDRMSDRTWGDLLPLKGHGDVLIRCVRTGAFAEQAEGVKANRKVTVRGRVHPYQKGRNAVVMTECDLLSK